MSEGDLHFSIFEFCYRSDKHLHNQRPFAEGQQSPSNPTQASFMEHSGTSPSKMEVSLAVGCIVTVGDPVGKAEGVCDGVLEGVSDGMLEGISDGTEVGIKISPRSKDGVREG
jgi:hypothetical protein